MELKLFVYATMSKRTIGKISLDRLCFKGDTYDNGVLSPESHMWSIVQIDNAWYHCDVTWDDTDKPYIRHAYLNLNDKLMFAARIAKDTHEKLRLPQCTSSAANAVMHEGIYVESGSNVDYVLKTHFSNVINSGGGHMQFVFENSANHSTALILLQNQEFYDKIGRSTNKDFSATYNYCSDVNYIEVEITL